MNMSQKRIQNRDTAQHSSDMVERVALPVTKDDRDLWKFILDAPFATCVQINNLADDCPELQAIARHRLEASHYAELVEALRSSGRALYRIARIASKGSAVRLQAEAEIGSVSRVLAKLGGAA